MFAYHLGDLDEFHFPHCQWAADYHQRARIEEVVLIYSGLKVPVVQAFGISERFGGLLDELMELLPEKFYCHYQKKYHSHFLQQYDEKNLGSHIKMQFTKKEKPESIDNSILKKVTRLDESHAEQLVEFYRVSFPDNYFDKRMLESEKTFGIFENGQIVSVAGVHIDSKEYSVTALGNIATHPEYRGKGLAQAVTAALLNDLKSNRDVITLNVAADNLPAIKCYANLGFVKTHDYEEGLFTKRQ